MEDLIISMFINLLWILIPILVGMLIGWVKQKYGAEKMLAWAEQLKLHQEVALLAVRFAEQAYRDFGGDIKKEKALAFMSAQLAQLGMQLSTEAMSGLIEAALRKLKDEFTDQWVSTIKE